MLSETARILFHPFVRGDLAAPSTDTRILLLGARAGLTLPPGFPPEVEAVQGFRPDYLALRSQGRSVSPTLPEGLYGMTLVQCGRHRGQNELWIADAIRRTSPDGVIVVAGTKEEGAASLRTRMDQLVAIDGYLPKYHGVAFWFRRPDDAGVVEAILRSENSETLVDGRFSAAPGMFSHDRVDSGSRLLADSLPGDIAGDVADFCAGWGYLSSRILERFPSARRVDLYEAEFTALEAARRNVDRSRNGAVCDFFWTDLLNEPVERRYDAIVMNPPFHADRAADPGMGQGMIRAAATALAKGGRLFVVANRHLQYEATLADTLREVAEVARDGQFKVFVGTR